MLAKCACGLWEIEVPENTEKIAEHEGSFLDLRKIRTTSPDPESNGLGPEICDENGKKTMGHFIKNSVLMNSNWDLNSMLTC